MPQTRTRNQHQGRPSLDQARQEYPNRYTQEHAPLWAARQAPNGKYYAPHFRSDLEWYQHTKFPGEDGWIGISTDCYTTNQTWPLGQWLDQAYQVPR